MAGGAGIILDGHEYLGPVVGEVNTDGTPVTQREQEAGMMQHSEIFGRYPPEAAPLALPFDANGHMLDPVYRDPCISQVCQPGPPCLAVAFPCICL